MIKKTGVWAGISMSSEKVFHKGSYLFIEGDEQSGSVFLIKKGRVTHICSSPKLATALKDAGEGDFIGFISAFSDRPRLSSAIATEETLAVEIEREDLFRMLQDKPEIAMKIMNSYSHSLQEYDNVLVNIKPIGLLYPNSMSLMRLGEFYMDKGDNILASYIYNRYVQVYPDSENISEIRKCIDDMEDSVIKTPFTENDRGELLYHDRAVIFCEYEPGDNLYFIEEGKVKITKQSGNRDLLLAILGKGEIFGELALLSKTPRSATAVSFGGAKLTPVDMDSFSSLLSGQSEMIKKIITSISQRLWFNHIRLGQMSYRNPATRLFTFLESKLLEDGVSLSRKAPHVFQFGLDELIGMNELSYEENSDEITELVNSRHLSFKFGTITVINPKDFSAEVQFYKQRDRLPLLKTRATGRIEELQPIPDITDEQSGFEKELLSEILPELSDDDPSKRVNAVIRLGELGEKARDSVPHLQERLGDNVKIIRKNAARSIMNILTPGETFKLFSDALKENNQDIRSAAVTGLGELNIADRSEIIELLIKSLKDPSPVVRSSAARSLGYFETDAEQAAPHLIKLLRDSDSSVRMLAVNSLEKIIRGGDYLARATEAVKDVSKSDEDKFVKNAAREILIKLNRRKKRH